MAGLIHILHENSEWVVPLCEHLDELGAPYREWFLADGAVGFDDEPPLGVFYNRISASAHTRGHRFSPEFTLAHLHWLAKNGRRVLNDHNALQIEVSKIAQYRALQAEGVRTPRTVAVLGSRDDVVRAAERFPKPFILKPNRGGKGAGVSKFESADEVGAYLDGLPAEELPIDGLWLLQQYIHCPEQYITRCELIGREFLYAVRVDTSEGFELCPADQCQLDEQGRPIAPEPSATNKFSIIGDFDEHALIQKYAKVMRNNGIHIAGFEFVRDADGTPYTYDLNTNTNYNAQAEREGGVKRGGMATLARYLQAELQKVN